MTGFSATTHSNIKQVMRTALVGISPADQLILKGYLRVLLHLEVDLEWVPANHPQVDLLFINEEFKFSPSVQKLLSNKSDIPMLFIKRNPDGQGALRPDTLVLPLKELPDLNKWLMTNVAVLKLRDPRQSRQKKTETIEQNPVNSSVKRSKDILNNPEPIHSSSTKLDPNKLTENETNQNAAQPQQKKTVDLSQALKGIIEFAKLISQRPEGAYELMAGDVRIGVVDLKHQKIWLQNKQVAFDRTWQLNPIEDSILSSKSDELSLDLFQWLWSKVWESPQVILPLVSDAQTYQLRYWPKPTDKNNRTELLRIFTALEVDSQNISAIASLAQTSVDSVKKVVASLIVSGGLKKEVYTQLDAALLSQSAANAELIDSPTIQDSSTNAGNDDAKRNNNTDAPANEPFVSTGSALEDALLRRKHAESMKSAATKGDNSESTLTSEPSSAEKNTEKRGFLSRLRKKLGL